MRALVWQGGRQLDYGEVPEPRPDDGEVVVDVEIAGICGSDMHAYHGHPGPRVPPLVLGHEVVARLQGARVTVNPLIGCGRCDECRAGRENRCSDWRLVGMHRPGVFAERVCVPVRAVVPLPDELESTRAVLAEPLACCVGALGAGEPPARTLVLGCGPIGLLVTALIARRGGEAVAVDPLPERRAMARDAGAIAAASAYSAVEHGTFDLVVDAAGFASTWRVGVEALRPGGELVVVGLGQPEGIFPMASVVRRAIHVRGHFAYTREDFATALRILEDRSMRFGWVDELPLSDGALAFENLARRPSEFTKVLLRP